VLKLIGPIQLTQKLHLTPNEQRKHIPPGWWRLGSRKCKCNQLDDRKTSLVPTRGLASPRPLFGWRSCNEDGFGSFNQTVNSFDGFTHSSDSIEFVLTNTSGTWADAASVLTFNSKNHLAAAHIFVTSDPADAENGAIVTGFASGSTIPSVPEPTTMLLLGSGLIGLAGYGRKIYLEVNLYSLEEGKGRVWWLCLFCLFLPEIAKASSHPLYQISSDNPQKDNFHKLIFDIDKIAVFGIINSTRLIALSLSKGWSMEKDL